jgi:hypothetical protein
MMEEARAVHISKIKYKYEACLKNRRQGIIKRVMQWRRSYI